MLASRISTAFVCPNNCELTAPSTFVTQRWERFTMMAISTETARVARSAGLLALPANSAQGSPRSLAADQPNMSAEEVTLDHASSVYSSNRSLRTPVMTSCCSTVFTARRTTPRSMQMMPPASTATLKVQGCTAVTAPATTIVMGASRMSWKGMPIIKVKGTAASGFKEPKISASSGETVRSPMLLRPIAPPKQTEMGMILDRNS
mmetsp:Transcript_30187/g.86478  ORF Transcript_30187/g.86478 Transcript_30187/m.86478 type:complete len:205 (+) Transcript_30187:223-837(+)